MSKILFFTDVHLSHSNPLRRIDAYPANILAKMREVYQLAADSKVDFVVFGGDLFNTHRIYSYEVIGGAVDIVRSCPVPTYAVIGQHDLRGYNPDTYTTSTLAFFELVCCGVWRTIREPVELDDVVLYASHSYDDPKAALSATLSKKKRSVLVAHHLLHNDLNANYGIIPTGEMTGAGYSLILSGDLHCGFAPHEIRGTWFCNPGSIARQAINDKQRKVQCAIVEVAPKQDVKIELVELQSVKPADEVFDVAFVEEVREMANLDASRFVDGILQIELDAVDIFDLVERIGKSQGARQEVLDFILAKRSA